MATKQDIVTELRAAGYTGPVSFSKQRLEELIAKHRGPGTLVEVLKDEDFEEDIKLHDWQGLKPGDKVKIDDGGTKRFEFRFYRKTPAQEYVVVKNNRGMDRFIRPDLILDLKGKKVVDR